MPAWYQIESWIITWVPIIFMGLLVFFIWRTLKVMPRTKPQEIRPESDAAADWTTVAGAGVAVASTAAAVEVFAWCERNAASPVARALRRPGFEIQRLLGTREPDERQLEVGRAALAEILRVETKPPEQP